MALKFSGAFAELRTKLTGLNGNWDESQPNKKVLRLNGGVMNWFESTGSINFQGKDPGKATLEHEVTKLLYPDEVDSITATNVKAVTSEPDLPEPNPSKTASIEQRYLTTGVNEGELVIGIVRAVGTEYNLVTGPLEERLKGFDYSVEQIRVSECLPTISDKDEYTRIKQHMEAGDNLRKRSNNNAILAAGVAKKISSSRNDSSSKRAYIINSLKHPEEVQFLRKVYGDGFYLIGIHADEKRRHHYLTKDKHMTQAQANELIRIDEDERIEHGQRTRDTYHLADFFLELCSDSEKIKNQLQRFLDLIFSHPYKNPTFDEFAMFMAFNSSVRSGDLSRQVGAVISRQKQIIATGANDVPKSGGGLYWAELDEGTGVIDDDDDGKDHKRGFDSNKRAQSEIVEEIASSLLDGDLVDKDKKHELYDALARSKISDLTEFGRVVHAEMDALLSCARVGIPTAGSTLYCTTFPCHNCAKHIIASGIERVVYVEPYPKSRALDFHSDSIQLKSVSDRPTDETGKRVKIDPFIGVGPRRFLDLFSMSLGGGSKLRRKNRNGDVLEWDMSSAPLRTPLIDRSYRNIERKYMDNHPFKPVKPVA